MRHTLGEKYIKLDHDAIARVAHESLRAYCARVADTPPDDWTQVGSEHRVMLDALVRHLAASPSCTPEDFHERWRAGMARQGWRHGDYRSVTRLTHPHMVPFDQLSARYRSKQALLFAVIHHLLAPGRSTAG